MEAFRDAAAKKPFIIHRPEYFEIVDILFDFPLLLLQHEMLITNIKIVSIRGCCLKKEKKKP